MAPQFVRPYVKSNMNDAADAESIREAVARPNMRFVPLRTSSNKAVLALYWARLGFVAGPVPRRSVRCEDTIDTAS